MSGKASNTPTPQRTGLGLVFARLLGLKRAESGEEKHGMNESNSDRPRPTGAIFFAGTPVRSASSQQRQEPGMVVTNPAPDASEPAVPTGIIQEIKLG